MYICLLSFVILIERECEIDLRGREEDDSVNIFKDLHIISTFFRYMANADELARSYSFELRPLPSFENTTPAVRYPTSIHQETITERPIRSSSVNVLMNSAMIGSQISLPNRKVLVR